MSATLTERPAWQALEAHHRSLRPLHLRQLFAEDPRRAERFTLEAAGLCLDYSKHRITEETVRLLLALAAECDLHGRFTTNVSSIRHPNSLLPIVFHGSV